MLKNAILQQKQSAIVLIILGIFLFTFIILFLYLKALRMKGFTELLPTNETIGYLEFPTNLEETFIEKLKERFQIDWEKDILQWAGEKAALVFLKNPSTEKKAEEKLLPYFFIQTVSVEKAFIFLKTYQNPQKKLKEWRISGMNVFSTPALHFAFLTDMLMVAPSADGLTTLMAYQSSFVQSLGGDRNFRKIHDNIAAPGETKQFFLYTKPREIPPQIFSLPAQFFERMPSLFFPFLGLGISAEKNGKIWQGISYGLFEKSLAENPEHAYRALLLKLLPHEFDLMMAGVNLQLQLKKIDTLLLEEYGSHPSLKKITSILNDELFPGTTFEQDFVPLITKEFAFVLQDSKWLFITDVNDKKLEENIKKLRSAFKSIAGRFTPASRKIVLADGTKAEELIPNASRVKPFEEIFQGSTIRGLLFGKKGAIYETLSEGKWFISSDLTMLQKSLLLSKEPGFNFWESELYRKTLQGILKNPEFLGIAKLPWGFFSFSKRLDSSHMETNFAFVLN